MTGIAERLLGALQGGEGAHPGVRVNHARGALAAGTFMAVPGAAALSTAPHLQGRAVAVLARFSNSTGIPDLADDDTRADPRGIAVRFSPEGGGETDLVGHTADGFPARTPAEFLLFIKALNARRTDPARFEDHLAAHPAARRFLDRMPAPPGSYLAARYHMLHAFALVAPGGHRTVGRLRFARPDGGEGRGAGALHRDLAARVAAGTATLDLVLQRAEPGDALDDVSAPWPERPGVVLGTLTLDRVVPEARGLAFDPGRLPPGLEAAGDPMLPVRSAVYRRAAAARSGGPPPAEAPSASRKE